MSTKLPDRPLEILLVEDDPADVDLTVEGLQNERTPSHIHVVADGVEALAYLQGQGRYAGAALPDLILLDLKMPRKSGLEVLNDIKADPQLHRIPVIVFTTSDAPDDVLRAYEFHANAYITKPSDLREFKRVMTLIQEFCLTVIKLPPRD